MKTFTCTCGNTVYFENTECLTCGRTLGFLPEHSVLSAFEADGDGGWRALAPRAAQGVYRKCFNYEVEEVCNWMIPADDDGTFCPACRLNKVIPNLGEPKNRLLWYRIESAKRRLLYNLTSLGLRVVGRDIDPEHGLAFQFLEGPDPSLEFTDAITPEGQVLTGHHDGLITINLAEADDSARESMREKMNEGYRTLLGHFRHEIGHYYWDRLLQYSPELEAWRALFGDERQDYAQALANYYAGKLPVDWRTNYLSAYAAAHPWEDWAETWAHYLHMTATLETANDYGFAIAGRTVRPPVAPAGGSVGYAINTVGFDELVKDWERLTRAMNALNRSMGLLDAYPFVLREIPIQKLRFVHDLIARQREINGNQWGQTPLIH